MIKLFDKDTIDFTTLGIGVLKDAISCEVAEKINADFEVEMEYPITGQLFDEIRNLRILYLKPNDYTNEQPFRIYSITKPIDGVVTINAQHISYDLSGYLLCPKQNEQGEYPIYTNAKSFFQALNTEIQNGNVYPNNCKFSFECDIEDETEGIQISEIANVRKILTSAAEAFEGEYEFDGFVVRMKSKRGTNRGFSVTYSKNMVELEATVNSQSSATGIFPYFKSEETKTVQGITRTWVKVYIAQNGEYPKANWLTDKAESQQAVTPVITTQAYIVTLRPDDPASYDKYKDHIVMWRTTIENSYVIAGFTPDENGNYPYNAFSAEKDSDISIVPVNKHYYRTVSNSVYTYYKFDSTSNKYIKQDNEGEYEDITDQKPVFCFVNQNPTKDSSGETVMDEHYLVDDFGKELSPAAGKDYMTSLNEMIGIMNHFYYWTTDDFDNAIQLWVISGKEKNQNGNYESDALTATQGSTIPCIPINDKWCKISVDSSYEYYRYSSEEGFYMRQTGTGRYHEYPKDHKFEAAPTIISTMSETKTLEHYVDLPEKIIYVNGLENQQYQKITQVDLTEYLNDKLATRVGSTVYEYDQVTINENAVMYSSEWLNVGGEPELDFIAQQITTTDKTDENGKNFYGRLFCWNGTKYYEVYGLPRTYLMTNAEKDSDGNYSKTSFCETVNSETSLIPVNNFVYKILQGVTYYYYRYNDTSEKFELMKQDGSNIPMNPSQFPEDTFLCATYKENPETHVQEVDKAYVEPRRKRILNSAEPSEQELRDAAVEYLEKNDVNVANNTFTVTFAKLSRSPEYSKWKELEHVELGDSISIIYSDLGVVQHEIEVVGLAYDALNDKYTQVELGNVATSLADTAVTSSDGVSVLKNDKGYTDVKKVADIIAENITANYIKAMTAEFTEAQIQQLEATRLDITEALTASQASIDEIVSNLLIADDAVIKNTLTSGEISVKGDISIESGEINLGIIAQFNENADEIYFKNEEDYIPVYRTVIDPETEQPVLIREYYNPNTTYYVDDGEHPMFTVEKASNIGVKYGDTYQSVVGTFWEENRIYYKNNGTVETPNWQQVTITSDNVGEYTDNTTRYVSVDIEDNLKDYADTNKGYRFNVENTGSMLIQDNVGHRLLYFDDGTGSLILYGDVQSHRVIADNTLIVGSEDIESASMYYNPTDGLKIVDGEINLNDLFRVDREGNLYVGGITAEDSNMYYNPTDGLVINEGTVHMNDGSITLGDENNFTVTSDGEVHITDGAIQLGPIYNDYSATPTIQATGFEVENNLGSLTIVAQYNDGKTLPDYKAFDYSFTITGYNLPTGMLNTAEPNWEVNENGDWVIWAEVSIMHSDNTPFVNHTGDDIIVRISGEYKMYDKTMGTYDDVSFNLDCYIPEGQSSASSEILMTGYEEEYYNLINVTVTSHTISTPRHQGTVTNPEMSQIAIPAKTNLSTLTVSGLSPYIFDATYAFVCEASGVQIDLPQHFDGYRFEVNNDGELTAAGGVFKAETDTVTLFDGRLNANNDEISLNADDEHGSSLIADSSGVRIINGPLYAEGGVVSEKDIVTEGNIISNSEIQAQDAKIDNSMTLGNFVARASEDDTSKEIVIDVDFAQKEIVDITQPYNVDKGIRRVFMMIVALAEPEDPQYSVATFDYSYPLTFTTVLTAIFRRKNGGIIPEKTWYSFTEKAVNTIYIIHSKTDARLIRTVYKDERYNSYSNDYGIKVTDTTGRYMELDELLNGEYLKTHYVYYTYYKFTEKCIDTIYYAPKHQHDPDQEVYDPTTVTYVDRNGHYLKKVIEEGIAWMEDITFEELVSGQYCEEDRRYFNYTSIMQKTASVKEGESSRIYVNITNDPQDYWYTYDINLSRAQMPVEYEFIDAVFDDELTNVKVSVDADSKPKYPKIPSNNAELKVTSVKILQDTVEDGEYPKFTAEKASDIAIKDGDNYQSVVDTFWDETETYYKNHGTVETPDWRREYITSRNVGNYTELAPRYITASVQLGENTNPMFSGYFNNLSVINQRIVLNGEEYMVVPLYVHRIKISSDTWCIWDPLQERYTYHTESEAITAFVTYKSTNRSLAFKEFSGFVWYLVGNDCLNEGSIYYTGIENSDTGGDTWLLRDMPCTLYDEGPIRYCSAAYGIGGAFEVHYNDNETVYFVSEESAQGKVTVKKYVVDVYHGEFEDVKFIDGLTLVKVQQNN